MSMSVEMILRLIDQATGPLRGVSREMDHLKASTEKLNAQKAAGIAAGGVRASTALKEQAALAAAAGAEEKYAAAIASRAAMVASAGVAAGVGVAAYGLREAIAFDKAMADVKKKIDAPGGDFGAVERMINRTSREIGIARGDIAALAAAAGQAGVEYKDLSGFMQLSARAAGAWDIAPQAAAQRLAEIKAQTQWTIPQLEAFADKVNALGDSSAAKESDIVEMFQRAGGAAKAAGVDFDATLAALTALKSTGMQESTASRFWNAFSSKLMTAGEGAGAKKAAEALKDLGLSVKSVEAGMKSDATRTIIDILDRLDRAKDKAAIGVKLFGKEWWDEATRAGQALPELRKNLDMLASGKWRGSLARNLDIDLATTARHLERTKAMVSEIGDGLMRWALPPINAQLERMLKSFETFRKTGFLPGRDGQPIDRLKDKTPVPFSGANRDRFLRAAERGRGAGESGADYERRLGLDRDPIRVPAPAFAQPRPSAPRDIPSGPALPTFAGGAAALDALNKTYAPKIDTSQLDALGPKARGAESELLAALGQPAAVNVDTSAMDAVGPKAQGAAAQMRAALGTPVSVRVDSSALDALLGKISRASAGLAALGRQAAAASRGASGGAALHDGPEAH